MTTKKINREEIDRFYQVILSLKDEKECAAFFEDLCTVKEVEQMSARIHAAELLMEGKTYSQVISETDISSATLSRVSRCVQYGTGYTEVLKKSK